MNRLSFYYLRFTFLAVCLLFGGCGIVSVLGTPSSHEGKVPAEYNLAEHPDRKVLILVNQPAYLNAQTNLRYYLTKSLRKSLILKVAISPEYVIDYDKLSEFRSSKPGFSLLSPAEVGKALVADMVLFVTINDYELSEVAQSGYYKGFLGVQAILFDTVTGERLWPKTAKSKGIKVGFDMEKANQEIAVDKLAAACAYCTTRYFYTCRKNKFKIAEDRSDISWESWGK